MNNQTPNQEQKNKKKCPFCAEEIQDDAIVCKHCGREIDTEKVKKEREKEKERIKKEKNKWTPKKIGCVVIFMLFWAIIGILALTGKFSSNTPTQQSNVSNVDFSKIEETVNGLVVAGLIQKIEYQYNKIYVSQLLWTSLNVQQKENTAVTLAYYCGFKNGQNIYWVEIYDWQSGEKLAKYDTLSGFKVYTK